MPTRVDDPAPTTAARRQLLADAPVTQRFVEAAGITTAVLEGGAGPPLVLLHGPGEFAEGWVPVLPALVATHRVIAPDLPGHGASEGGDLSGERVLVWLAEVIEQTCPAAPTLVGKTLGGAIAARLALARPDRVQRLVLVDTFGLSDLSPAPRLELALTRFLSRPSERSYDRLMAECMFDVDGLRDRMGEHWEPFERYAIERASTPRVQAAIQALIGEFGVAAMPPADLRWLAVPVALIWGRHDLATPLAVAESASASYDWPLRVIDDAGDDPALEQPAAFVAALMACLATPNPTEETIRR
jgi:pimeloyl-ACP methyl ester carboxylesterase